MGKRLGFVVFLATLAGCGSCLDDKDKKEEGPPAVTWTPEGGPVGVRRQTGDRRFQFFDDAGGD
jgi:hypothetical protein